MSRPTSPAVVGIDAGGTFTDAVTSGPGGLRSAKVPSTPDDPARAVLAALAAVGGLPARGSLRHGTTVATNALLTHTGAAVALVATRGFGDLLHIGRGHRDDLHAMAPSRTRPLVPASRCVEVDGRLGAHGESISSLTPASLAAARAALAASGARSIAVCLLHATARGAHEDRVARALAGLGLPVSVSHRLCADAREVERAETTVLDAYVGPRIRAYVAALAAALPQGALSVLRSDGARMPPAAADREPVRTLLSGPAGGAAAAHALARRLRIARALAFDVGGTSTDVTWIEGRVLPVTTTRRIGGFAMAVPSLDVHSVGAGGGSIVRLDAGGALRVGPESAGADPGPAAYGRGGPFTLTDAHLLLGRLPRALLGGTFPLGVVPARRAGMLLARRAGLSLRAVCEGAVAVAVATTARALRVASAAQGRDPRGASLVAFGGAGGLLAADVARSLGLLEVVVPWSPGTFAAQGARIAPRSLDVSRAVVPGSSAAAVARLARTLGADASAAFGRDGERPAEVRVEADARYRGQSFEIPVAFGAGWERRFHVAHAARHGFRDDARPIEVVRLRARAVGATLPLRVPTLAAARGGRARVRRRPGVAGRVGVVARDDLAAGAIVRGPAVVEEDGATTWVPAGAALRAAHDGTLRLREGR
jgi:N-methylhydantoinase A